MMPTTTKMTMTMTTAATTTATTPSTTTPPTTPTVAAVTPTPTPKQCRDCTRVLAPGNSFVRCYRCNKRHRETLTSRCTAKVGGVVCGKAIGAEYNYRCYAHVAVPYTHCGLCGGHLRKFTVTPDWEGRGNHMKCWLAARRF